MFFAFISLLSFQVCVADWLAQLLRRAARELVDSVTPWDATFVYGTMENHLSATTVVRVYVDRGAPVVSCLVGISKYLKFDFDSDNADSVNAYSMNDGVCVSLMFSKLLTEADIAAEAAAEQELQLHERLLNRDN